MTNNDLINKIKRLEKVEPSESWLVSNREFIFKYIDLDEVEIQQKESFIAGSIFNMFTAIASRINFALSIFQKRKILAGATAMAAVLIMAGGAVVGQADASLPGDNFYGVKTFMEKARLAFAFNDEKRVALNFEFTEKRLDEFSMVASQKDGNPKEVKAAADNLKNQLKVAAQELSNAKTNLSSEKAVSVAKIADTKTAAYVKKLNEVKKEISNEKQVQEVAANIEELNYNALAVLVANTKEGDANAEEIANRLKKEMDLSGEKIDELEAKVAAFRAQISASDGAIGKETAESAALAEKLVLEARDVLKDAAESFEKNDFPKTWEMLANAGEIIKVAENVSARATVATATPAPQLIVSPSPETSIAPSPEPSVLPSSLITPEPAAIPETSLTPEAFAAPKPSISPSPTLKENVDL